MTQLAEYDLLTGLANRYATLRGLRNDVSMPASLSRLGLLFIDLDNFKTVNDTLGHNAGDIVLQMTASRLSDAVGDEGSLAHRRRRVRRGDEGRRRRAARGAARGSDHPDVRRTVRRARQLVRAACEHRHRAAHGRERERDRPAEESRSRDVQREGCRQELLPVLCAAPVAPRRPPDALGAATARRARRGAAVPRVPAEDRPHAPPHHRLRGARAGITPSTGSSPRTNSFRLPNPPA